MDADRWDGGFVLNFAVTEGSLEGRAVEIAVASGGFELTNSWNLELERTDASAGVVALRATAIFDTFGFQARTPGPATERVLAVRDASGSCLLEDGCEDGGGGAPGPPPPAGAWAFSGARKSASCDRACEALGLTCNASRMDELDTAAGTRAAMEEAGVACDLVKFRKGKISGKEGVPGYRVNRRGKNVCVPARSSLAEPLPTTCGKKLGNFRSLCWCE